MNIPTRQNNPGDLKDPATGTIRTFTDATEGKAALYNDLTSKMTGTSTTGINGNSSLVDFANVYAPKSDNNDSVQYAANLANKLHVSPDTKIGSLMSRIDDFANAVSENEGYQSGQPSKKSIGRKTFSESVQDIQTQNPTTDNLKETGNGGILDTFGNVSGVQKLGQGLGYAISNLTGTQDNITKSLDDASQTESGLLARIKEKKAKGEDTTRLQKALNGLLADSQKTASTVSDAGTGGITNGQVLGSAAQTLGTVLTAPSIIKSGIGLVTGLKGGSALLSEPVTSILTKYAGKDSIATLSSAEKVNALTEALSSSEPAVKPILSKALQELAPQVLKDAGVGSFSELNPKTAKAAGLAWNAVKFLARSALDVAGLKTLSGILK